METELNFRFAVREDTPLILQEIVFGHGTPVL